MVRRPKRDFRQATTTMRAIPRRHSKSLPNTGYRTGSSVHAAVLAQGIPYKTIEKFSNPAWIKLAAISQMTE